MSTTEVSVYEAKTHLSSLLRRAEAGEEILIRRGKTVVARLIAAVEPSHLSVPDRAAGAVWMSDDFNSPLDEFDGHTS
jgi:antitoxin (DNA-binding transcriptional repressor) of toxin-antitoxin stability system